MTNTQESNHKSDTNSVVVAAFKETPSMLIPFPVRVVVARAILALLFIGLTIAVPLAGAENVVIDSNALTMGGSATSFRGVPFRTVDEGGCVAFYIAGDLTIGSDDTVTLAGTRAIRLIVGGDAVFNAGAVINGSANGRIAGPGGGLGGATGPGGSGSWGPTVNSLGYGGRGGMYGSVTSSENGLAGTKAANQNAFTRGGNGGAYAGQHGYNAIGGGAPVPSYVGIGAGGVAGGGTSGNPGGGGGAGTWYFFTGSDGGAGGSGYGGGNGGNANVLGGNGYQGIPGGNPASGEAISGGGGGSSGSGGGGGSSGGTGGSGGGGGGGGQGGGAGVSGIGGYGGRGGDGGAGGRGGSGGWGGTGGAGGGGGGALEICAYGRMTVAGQLLARGGTGSAGSAGAAGSAGMYGASGAGGAAGQTGDPSTGRGGNGGVGGSGGRGGTGSRGGDGGHGAGGAGGTVKIIATTINSSGASIDVTSTGPGGGNGRFLFGTNTGQTYVGSAAGSSPTPVTGPRVTNSFLGATSPTIPGTTGGPEAFGILEGCAAASVFPDAPPGAMAALMRCSVGPAGFDDNFVGYQMVVYANLSSGDLNVPRLRWGTSGEMQQLLLGGRTRRTEFGGTGLQTLSALPPGAVYAVLVPAGAQTATFDFEHFGVVSHTEPNIALDYPVYLGGSKVQLYVDANAAPGGDGTSWATAYQDLQTPLKSLALLKGRADADIWVAEGTYKPNEGTSDRSKAFAIPAGVRLYGGFAGTASLLYPGGETLLEHRDWKGRPTILSGDINGDDVPGFANHSENSYRVVQNLDAGGESTIDGFTITGGYGDAPGAFGAGIDWTNTDCTLNLRNSTIADNSSTPVGAGLYANRGRINVSNCTFKDNYSESAGAGVFLTASAIGLVERCRFLGNKTGAFGEGAGLYASADASIRDCLFTGNVARDGGAARVSDPDLFFRNCTIVGNSLWDYTVGEPRAGGISWNGALNVRNSILWDNEGTQITPGGTPSVTYSCVQEPVSGAGNISQNPAFVDAKGADGLYGTEDDNCRLGLNSPCIDAGNNGTVASTIDLDGKPRRMNVPQVTDTGSGTAPIVDMGAYETSPQRLHVDASAQPDGDGSTWELAFRDLQDALRIARSLFGTQMEIWVAKGTYLPDSGSGLRTDSFEISDGVKLYGGFLGTRSDIYLGGETDLSQRDFRTHETILSGDIAGANSYHVIIAYGVGSETLIDGFTIRDGLTMMVDDERGWGAGMYISQSDLLISNCRFTSNMAYKGAGLFCDVGSLPKVVNCFFHSNWAQYSGAGAFNKQNSNGQYINCVFSGNRADQTGAAMNNRYSNPTLINCTVANHSIGNGVPTNGAGINNNNSNPIIRNSILWGNGDGSFENQIGGNFSELSYSCVQGLTTQGTSCIADDPLFFDADGPDDIVGTRDDNLRLKHDSPCIDVADESLNLEPLDADSNPRILDLPDYAGTSGYAIDMGAYERLPRVLYVNQAYTGTTKGTSWDEAVNDLQTALKIMERSVGSQAQLWVSEGTYYPDLGSGARFLSFVLENGIELYGGFKGLMDETSLSDRDPSNNQTVLSGAIGTAEKTDNSYHVVTSNGNDSTAVLDGFAVIEGYADGDPVKFWHVGAGMLIRSSNPTVRNCFFVHNEAVTQGGGVYVGTSSLQFSDCEFASNKAATEGGGVFVASSSLEFTDCQFKNNVATTTGGGVHNTPNSVCTFNRCTIQGNAAGNDPGLLSKIQQKPKVKEFVFRLATGQGHGGALYNDGSATTTLRDCIVRDNTAADAGGGIYNKSAAVLNVRDSLLQSNASGTVGGAIVTMSNDLTIVGTTLLGNRTLYQGGALYMENVSPTIVSSKFYGNNSYLQGGAIYNDGGRPALTNCVFDGNSSDQGGGICNQYNANVTLSNCTFHGNWAANSGGGVANLDTSKATFSNCILWNNSDAGGITEQSQAQQASQGPLFYSCCVQGWTGTLPGSLSFGDDPLFRDPLGPDNQVGTLDNDLGLAALSPCIDRGNNTLLPQDVADLNGNGNTTEILPYDINGFRRLVQDPDTNDMGVGTAPFVDAGAYEFQLDCNGNDYPDYLDIAEGTSNDSNLNEVPDECELTPQPVIYVDASATGTNTGANWADAFIDLQAAIQFAATNGRDVVEQIWVAKGVYYPDRGTGDRTLSFRLLNDVAVFGGFAGANSTEYPGGETSLSQRNMDTNKSILSGDIGAAGIWTDNSYHVLTSDDATGAPTIDGFTITKGNANGDGDSGKGGGLLVLGGSPTVWNCAFQDCRAKQGAGVYSHNGEPQLVNCVIRNCQASEQGGALMAYGETVFPLINCTIVYNSASNSGGGVLATSNSFIYVMNSILWANSAGSGTAEDAQIAAVGGQVSLDSCCVQGYTGTLPGNLNFGLDPRFDHDGISLRMDSPCVDAGSSYALPQDRYDLDGNGDTTELLPVDIKGYRRLLDSPHAPNTGSGDPVVDIGAAEAWFDCDGNGIPDYLDVENNPERDSDGNGILDDCEYVAYVDASATGTSDGTSWYDAYNDLQDALELAKTNPAITEVWVADGTYAPAPATGERTVSFNLPDGVGVYGGFGGLDSALYYNGEWERDQRDASVYEAILTGDLRNDDATGGDTSDNCYHVVTARLVGATTTLDSFTIVGGNANGTAASGDNTGGGILVDTASPVLARLTIKNSKATGSGGGIYIRKNSSPSISDCVFLGNTASLNGGGVYNLGNGTFTNCSFLGNRANGFGGGIINQENTTLLAGCLFSGNTSAGAGAGVYNSGNANQTYINCTFSGNTAGQDGGGIASFMSTTTVTNSILWGNTDRSGTGEIAQLFRQGGSLTVDYSCITNWTRGGTNNITEDPQFVLPLGVDGVAGTADDNLRLAPGSPCLDAGNNFVLMPYSLETDLAGDPRIQDDPCAYDTGNAFFFGSPVVDMGVYEHFYPSEFTNQVVYVDSLATGNNDGTSWANAYIDLQDALDAARGCQWVDQIWVAQGTYKPDQGTDDRDQSFELVNDVALYGGFAGWETSLGQRDWRVNQTVLSGEIGNLSTMDDNTYTVVKMLNLNHRTLLDGFTVTGGYSPDTAGGVLIQGGYPFVMNCTLYQNVAVNGGGMVCDSGGPYIANCRFLGNYGQLGGGSLNRNNSTAEYVNCLFSGNLALLEGGGMRVQDSAVSVTNCTFSHNAIVTPGVFYGGGIYKTGGAVPTVSNSILWNNGGTSQNHQTYGVITYHYSTLQSWNGVLGGVGNDGSNPQFANALGTDGMAGTEDDDLRLTVGSPCLDSGDGTVLDECAMVWGMRLPRCVMTDLDGNPRFQDDPCAFETGVRREPTEPVVDRGPYEHSFPPVYPERLYVDANASGSQDGLSWANAYRDLQDALAAASMCACVEEIWVADGTYKPDRGTGNRNAAFALGDGLQLYGGFAGANSSVYPGGETHINQRNWDANVTILSGDLLGNDLANFVNYGDNSLHIVSASGLVSGARLDGFVIERGNASDHASTGWRGGGMIMNNSIVTIANCHFRLNYNGAVQQRQGDAFFDGCLFENNSIANGSGGAVALLGLSPAQDSWTHLRGCRFIGNHADFYGGALYAFSAAEVKIEACELMGNTSNGHGAAAYMQRVAEPFIVSSMFSGNRAGSAGMSGQGGGGYVSESPNLKVINSTFANNSGWGSTEGAGGLAADGAEIANSILWGNSFTVGATVYSAAHNQAHTVMSMQPLVVNHTHWQNWTGVWGGDYNSGTDPKFADADGADNVIGTADDDLSLSSGSPCLDRGSNAKVPDWNAIDAGGNTRIQDEPCSFEPFGQNAPVVDIGAYEHNFGTAPTRLYVDSNAAGTETGLNWSDAHTKLEDALDRANSCAGIAEIWVAAGTYKPDGGTGNRGKSFAINGRVRVFGGFEGVLSSSYPGGETLLSQRNWRANPTILSGNVGSPDSSSDNSYHVVTSIYAKDYCRLDGFIIEAGNASGAAGNMDDVGGGMLAAFSQVYVFNCAFLNNSAVGGGGGLHVRSCGAFLVNCFFGRNSANLGGGLQGQHSGLELHNTVFSSNLANGGAGLHLFSSETNIVNNTFYGNVATGDGGGCLIDTDRPFSVNNSILWGNQDRTGYGQSAQMHFISGTATVNNSCVQGWLGTLPGVNITLEDPMFMNPKGADGIVGTLDDDLRLSAMSPCIDSGNNSYVIADFMDANHNGNTTEEYPYDFAGSERLLDDPLMDNTGSGTPPVDMGAFEFYMDCNSNGVPDYVEIANDPSLDADGNGILDECNTFVGDELVPPLGGADLAFEPYVSNNNIAFVHPYDQKVYAKAPGTVKVSWARAGIPQSITGTFTVLTTPGTVTAYITSAPYNAPKVEMDALKKSTPSVDVIFHYNATIKDDPTPDNPLTNPEAYLDILDQLSVEKVGQILLEYRNRETREPLAFEILDVKNPVPVITAGVDVGTELRPSSPDKTDDVCHPKVSVGLIGTPYVYQQGAVQPGPTQYKVYAIRPTNNNPNRIEVYWYKQAQLDVQWPSEVHRYITQWPAQPQKNLRGSGTHPQVSMSKHFQATIAYQFPENHATIADKKFSTTAPGRATILYSEQIPEGTTVSFEVVHTVDHMDLRTTQMQNIGDRIVNMQHDYSCYPCGFVYSGTAYDPLLYNADIFMGNTAYDGSDMGVFPVNRGNIEMWWYETSQDVCWPVQPVLYQCDWPAAADNCIIVANGKGIPGFPQAKYLNPEIYWKGTLTSDVNEVGYNPNEEHAEWIQVPGENLHASRDDYNIVYGRSEPYVLIRYRDNEKPNKSWEFDVIQVVPESPMGSPTAGCVCEAEPCTFVYSTTAGYSLTPPVPLIFHIPYCGANTIINTPVENYFWDDQKGRLWFRRGETSVTARFFENWQGECTPWLDYGTGIPQNIVYDLKWPSRAADEQNPPGSPNTYTPLAFGETRDRTGYGVAEVLYNDCNASLIMPWRLSYVDLPSTDVPDDYLTLHGSLPPHISSRLNYDDVNQVLFFKGVKMDGLLGIMSGSDRALIRQIFAGKTKFLEAVDALYTESQQPGAKSVGTKVGMENPNWGIAVSTGSAIKPGWLVIGYNGDPNVPEPVEVEIFYVGCPPETGNIQIVYPECPFTEQLTLRWSGDCGGDCRNLEFKWIFCEGANPPDFDDINTSSNPTSPPGGVPWKRWTDGGPAEDPDEGWVLGQNEIIISAETASGLFSLTDNWFQVKTRVPTSPPAGASYACPPGTESDWTVRQLAEGWLKRVKRAINPFDQRVREFTDDRVASYVGMIEQFGTPYTDRVPLSCNSEILNSLGLIEMYQACLLRGKSFSIDSSPQPVDYPPANQALVMMAGNLADFHMLLGNEAYGDAQDPTIGIGTDANYAAVSMFCFQDQLPTNENSLLFEELALLRGRDGRDGTRTDQFPVYNRLYWNFTSGDGQVAYVNNYNIQDFYPIFEDCRGDGIINEYDAQVMFPQGHGDAWGHYLSAMRFYYDLMRHPYFTWQIRSEAVVVNQQPVMISYAHERKFAKAAAAKAKAGLEITNLTYREQYLEDPSQQWKGYPDPANRDWGVTDWARRSFMAAYFDWAIANAMLPAKDEVHPPESLEKVDRTTIVQIHQIASTADQIQVQLDQADAGVNPLGLPKDVVPFDINPSKLDPDRFGGAITHFEQVYEKAVGVLNNTVSVFNHANQAAQRLRENQDAAAAWENNIEDGEWDYLCRLIEIFGYPYPEDKNPFTGATYGFDYEGPDLYHWMYVNVDDLLGMDLPTGDTIKQSFTNYAASEIFGFGATTASSTAEVEFRVVPGFGFVKPKEFRYERKAPGEIQLARSDLLQEWWRFKKAIKEYENAIKEVEEQADIIASQVTLRSVQIGIKSAHMTTVIGLNSGILAAKALELGFKRAADMTDNTMNSLAESLPTVLGMSCDVTSVARGASKIGGGVASNVLNILGDVAEAAGLALELSKQIVAMGVDIALDVSKGIYENHSEVLKLQEKIRKMYSQQLELYALQESMRQSSGRYQKIIAEGARLIVERTAYRVALAEEISKYRYKDMAFRVFRNDALQKYRAQFDLTARYAYLATKAYGYETNLLDFNSQSGERVLSKLVRERTLGRVNNGVPEAGSGLAGLLAELNANFQSIKGALGFSTGITATDKFSLRREFYRIHPGSAEGGDNWREALNNAVVRDLRTEVPEFRQFCSSFTPYRVFDPANPLTTGEPAIVIDIPEGTTVKADKNFFGWPGATDGGESFYPSDYFSIKIRGVGIWFSNYSDGTGGLTTTPRCYLVPVGCDVLRVPFSENAEGSRQIRQWKVVEQILPLPFDLGESMFTSRQNGWIPADQLSGNLLSPRLRSYPSLRAFHDGGEGLGSIDESQLDMISYLVGRSVWNTRWMLIIPGRFLLQGDPNEGIRRFIEGADGNGGVTDVRLGFKTYQYSGAGGGSLQAVSLEEEGR